MFDRPSTDRIVDVARRLGVELDAQEAVRWMLAVSSDQDRDSAFARDAATGICGHRLALLDFDPSDLKYFRALARYVRVVRRPEVESAIAISGSAAQGKVQVFPGDCDFYERINIKADTADAARAILRDMVRQTALRCTHDPDAALVEVNFGVYPQPVVERGAHRVAGDPITWTPRDLFDGSITVRDVAGRPSTIAWHEAEAGAGWTYIGWIVVDRESGDRIALASNMIEATWESPDGTLTALDGALDPLLQEVYLEADAIPLITRIASRVDSSARDAYGRAMRQQAFHYTHQQPDFCKASKRLYNLFRLTGELEAAAYVRELFDEPAAKMYQAPGLLDAADVALRGLAAIDRRAVLAQLDCVIECVSSSADRAIEAELVAALTRLKEIAGDLGCEDEAWNAILQHTRRRCGEMVSEYFRVRLLGLPRIAEFIQTLSEVEGAQR